MPPHRRPDHAFAARAGWPLAALLLASAALFHAACATVRRPPRAAPVADEASAAYEEARTWARSPEPAAHARALAALDRAIELEPRWIAPLRLLDDLRRQDLLGLDALAEHRAALARDPDDPVELYLAARLEGDLGAQRFARAASLAPNLAWTQHGLGWLANRRGERALAIRHGQRARDLARDPGERAYFAAAIARYHSAAGEAKRALAVLESELSRPDTRPVDHVELSVQAATIELGLVFDAAFERGRERALGLLRECELTDAEVEELVQRLRAMFGGEAASLELELALAARPGAVRDRLRAEILLESRPTPLALGLLQRSRERGGAVSVGGPLLRAARFSAGQFALAAEEWLADLPRAVLDERGEPRDARVRAAVVAARGLERTAGADDLAAFGELVLEAGWFREARAVAAVLAAEDLDRALALDERATAGQGFLLEVGAVMRSVDRGAGRLRGSGYGSADALARAALPPPRGAGSIQGLDGLLAALAPPLARAQRLLGGESDVERVARALASSPRLEYSAVGAVVHPGPRFSAADEACGAGHAGDAVPGIAEAMERLGRFAVFGQVLGGGGPDGTVLQRAHVESRGGEHLGARWSGTIAWCDGADLKSRAGRRGVDIAGAAVHEGYWIDVDAVRREREPWRAIAREFNAPGAELRLERALSARGLELATPAADREGRRRERRSAEILLGAAARVRLAVLCDRARTTGVAEVGLDELCEVTGLHEQGHLCDRARFLPLSEHVGRALAFLWRSGVSAQGVARRLEYRAQLVALCRAPDPRVPLVSVLAAGEGGGAGVTPHGDAYRELLEDLLTELDREVERAPELWPEIDPGRVLAHQLHGLGSERVRALAEALAAREGLVER